MSKEGNDYRDEFIRERLWMTNRLEVFLPAYFELMK